MNLIACIDNNWGIGYNNNLLFHIPDDLKRFKEITNNKVVVMGRKTFESLPNVKPLPNRINIVITKDKKYRPNSVVVINSFEELLLHLKIYKQENIFIIGGGIYIKN